MLKRLFDIIFSFLVLIILLPFLLIIGLWIIADSKGGMLYSQKRVGKNFKDFWLLKFRTMFIHSDKQGLLTVGEKDKRITRPGNCLRKYKIDELPQLLNILKGEMSFVGPRPEILSEIDTYSPETKKVILSVRPGMTDLATLANLHEEEILKGSSNPHQTYREKIKPEKIRLGMEYVRKHSFWLDIKILLKTISVALK